MGAWTWLRVLAVLAVSIMPALYLIIWLLVFLLSSCNFASSNALLLLLPTIHLAGTPAPAAPAPAPEQEAGL